MVIKVKNTPKEWTKILESFNNTIFTVTFVKRTTGEKRVMNCREGVTKYLRGGTLAYDPKDKALMIVFDLQKSQYRSINLEQILEVKGGGKVYVPEKEEEEGKTFEAGA